eukprot:5349444-Pleurochrysis_carterae.AAC.1
MPVRTGSGHLFLCVLVTGISKTPGMSTNLPEAKHSSEGFIRSYSYGTTPQTTPILYTAVILYIVLG